MTIDELRAAFDAHLPELKMHDEDRVPPDPDTAAWNRAKRARNQFRRALLAALKVCAAVGHWNDAQDPFGGKAIADAYDAFDAALRGDEGKP